MVGLLVTFSLAVIRQTALYIRRFVFILLLASIAIWLVVANYRAVAPTVNYVRDYLQPHDTVVLTDNCFESDTSDLYASPPQQNVSYFECQYPNIRPGITLRYYGYDTVVSNVNWRFAKDTIRLGDIERLLGAPDRCKRWSHLIICNWYRHSAQAIHIGKSGNITSMIYIDHFSYREPIPKNS